MVASYNGWLASQKPADFGGLDNQVVPGTKGVKLAPGVRKGAVATVLFYVASQLDARVEDGDLYTAGDEWGYYYKPSANSPKLLSCHSSATAFDWNSTRHPNGKRGTYTVSQVAEIRRILAEVDNIVYWGGDGWSGGTVDEMHFEIKSGVTEAQVNAVAARLIAAAAAAEAAPVAPAAGRPTVKLGSKGQAVIDLQTRLNRDYSAYSRLVADGDFGNRTDTVVREFQRRAGLVVDGVVGPATWKKLGL